MKKIIVLYCIYCGNLFKRKNKPQRSAVHLASNIRPCNALTCTKKCSIAYTNYVKNGGKR